MSPEADGRWRSEAWRCHACAAREHAAHAWAENEASDPAGVYFTHEEA